MGILCTAANAPSAREATLHRLPASISRDLSRLSVGFHNGKNLF
jgi:hypothetical protein